MVQSYCIGYDAESLLCHRFHAHIRSQHIKTQRETSQAVRICRRSDTEA